MITSAPVSVPAPSVVSLAPATEHVVTLAPATEHSEITIRMRLQECDTIDRAEDWPSRLMAPWNNWHFVNDIFRSDTDDWSNDIVCIPPDGLSAFYVTPNHEDIRVATEFTCTCGVADCDHIATIRENASDIHHHGRGAQNKLSDMWMYNAAIMLRDGETVDMYITPELVAEARRRNLDLADFMAREYVGQGLSVDCARRVYWWDAAPEFEYNLWDDIYQFIVEYDNDQPISYPLFLAYNTDNQLLCASWEAILIRLHIPPVLAAVIADGFEFTPEELTKAKDEGFGQSHCAFIG